MSKHTPKFSIGFAALSLALLVSLILLAACGTGAGSVPQATPTAINQSSPDTTMGEKTTPVPEVTGTVKPTTAAGFDCAGVNEIPAAECAALVALYNSTNGPNWADNSGWLTTNTPCSWTGINCTGDHVIDITLSYNQLTGPLPPALGNLSHLRVIQMGTNQLQGPIPAELGELDNLYALDLSHNQLSGVIPVIFGNLSKLDELDLSYNQLRGPVPEFVTHINQRGLWGNQFEGTITTDGQTPFNVDYRCVHFTADPSLATNVWPEVMPATPLPEVLEGPGYWMAIPEHIRFTFADPDLSPERRRIGFNLAAEGQILVFPLAILADMNPLVQAQIETLQNLLAEREPLPSGDLPLIPLTNSAQVFHAQAQYFDSDTIQGIRFISQHSQDPHPIMLSPEIFYTFQGVTNDGAYYVAAFFPLTTDILPDTIEVEDWEAFHANYDTYLLETTAVLDQLPLAEFSPDLTLLDAVVTSLRIDLLTLSTEMAGG